jgi:acetamidase/formamidase
MSRRHALDASPDTIHWGHFDARLKPVLTLASGDVVRLSSVNGGADIVERCPYAILPQHRAILDRCTPDMGRHIITGPVAVAEARPGDVLEILIEAVDLVAPWGFNASRPGLGALPDRFPSFRADFYPIDLEGRTASLPFGPRLALEPFFGIMAVAPPPAWGRVSAMEPRANGGNIDCRELQAGSRLFLPVFAEGALFSAGDGHAIQGDGEVSLTALETCLAGDFRLTVRRGRRLARPVALTPAHLVVMAFDPDLDRAVETALGDMLDLLVSLEGWREDDAYAFASMACDLRITQVVDGAKGVHAMVRRELLRSRGELFSPLDR